MKKQILSVCVMLLLIINASGQTIDLTFTAEDNGTYVQLDSMEDAEWLVTDVEVQNPEISISHLQKVLAIGDEDL